MTDRRKRKRHLDYYHKNREKINQKRRALYANLKTGMVASDRTLIQKNISTYTVWKNMKARCGPSAKERKYYYDKGIKICRRWSSFDNFLKDMGPKPNGLSLDRINNNKGYSKNNCRWATMANQNRNKSSNILFDNGKCLTDTAKELGLTKAAIISRLRMGWTKQEAKSIAINSHIKKPIINGIKYESIRDAARKTGLSIYRVRRYFCEEQNESKRKIK